MIQRPKPLQEGNKMVLDHEFLFYFINDFVVRLAILGTKKKFEIFFFLEK